MINKTDLFLRNIDGVGKNTIPPNVIMRAKCALLDYIGVTLAGLEEQRGKVNNLIDSFYDHSGEVYPVGLSIPMSMNNAVFINGLNGHALDFDDGTNAGIIHLGSPIFSVLLALAQKYNVNGEMLLKSAILGYETSFTMAMSIQPTHKQRGYHATGTCGMLGIAAAVSKLLNFDEKFTKDAFSTATVSASGTLKVLEDSSQLKPYNVAKTALLGLTAVQMASAGFAGPDDALSGVAGFLTQMYGDDTIELVPMMLNGSYAIEKAYIKPYAACRYTHPSIDIALEMRNNNFIEPESIEYVRIKTYSLAVKKHDHTDIKGSASAKMSIPYNFAVTYLIGETGMNAFSDENLYDNRIQTLTKKIIIEEDAEMTSFFPSKTIAVAELFLKDGRVISGKSILPKGEPENPLTLNEIIEKFTGLSKFAGKTDEESQKIIDAVFNLEDKLPELLELLR